MGIVLTGLQDELKSRTAVLGASSSDSSIKRLRYAIRKGAKQAWERQDWDFKNSTATLNTSAGNLGGYDAPSGLVRFATTRNVFEFGYCGKEELAPIYSDDRNKRTPYIKVQDGKIYFLSDPGSASLTLNFLGSFDMSIEEANLTATLAQIDSGLQDAIVTLATADLFKDLPGMTGDAAIKERDGLMSVDNYWEEVTRDKYPKTITPRGLNGVRVDFVARVVTVLGSPAVIRYPESR